MNNFENRAEVEMKLADKKRVAELQKKKNMGITEKVNEDIKSAMKEKNKIKLEALRAVKAELMKAATEKGAGGKVDEKGELAAINRMVKQRKESASIYRTQGEEMLAKIEEEQSKHIEVYLPEQLSDAEVETIIAQLVTDLGASSMRDMGKVMGAFQKDYAGKADGTFVSTTVKKLLA